MSRNKDTMKQKKKRAFTKRLFFFSVFTIEASNTVISVLIDFVVKT